MKRQKSFYQEPQISIYSVTKPHLMAGSTFSTGNSVKDWQQTNSNTEEGTITF